MKNKCILCALAMVSALGFGFRSAADAGHGWYVKRNGHHQPILSSDQAYIKEYGGYYLDTGVDDTSDRKVLYLTFDAGYENGNVAKILDVLKEENVPAAFFILDHLVLKNTDLVLRMANEGHLVCNHTKNHKDMTACTKEAMVKNLTDLEKIYCEKTGKELSKYFRFPEGKFNEDAMKCAHELGYKTIFWSFGYADWDNDRQPSPEKAKKIILENTHNGEVILLHPTSATNAKILKDLIHEWRSMGYSFGTLDELVASVNARGC